MSVVQQETLPPLVSSHWRRWLMNRTSSEVGDLALVDSDFRKCKTLSDSAVHEAQEFSPRRETSPSLRTSDRSDGVTVVRNALCTRCDTNKVFYVFTATCLISPGFHALLSSQSLSSIDKRYLCKLQICVYTQRNTKAVWRTTWTFEWIKSGGISACNGNGGVGSE